MEGKTHILSGLAVACATYKALNHLPLIDISQLHNLSLATGCILGTAVIGAIAPDLDIPESSASRQMTEAGIKLFKMAIDVLLFVSIAFIMVHAKSKYSLIVGVASIAFIFTAYGRYSRKVIYYMRLALQYGLVAFLAYMFIRTGQTPYAFISVTLLLYIISKHRGFSHTLVMNLFATYTVYYSFSYYKLSNLAPIAATFYLIGTLTHLYLNDSLTNMGVPNPLYPIDAIYRVIKLAILGKFQIAKVKNAFKIKRIPLFKFKTGGIIEDITCTIAILIIIYTLNIQTYIFKLLG